MGNEIWQDRIEGKIDNLIHSVGKMQTQTALTDQKLQMLCLEHDERKQECRHVKTIESKIDNHISEHKEFVPMLKSYNALSGTKKILIGLAGLVTAISIIVAGVNVSVKYAIRTWAITEITQALEQK